MSLHPLFWVAFIVFFAIFNVAIPIYVILRLASLDHNLDKAVLLLTILANKQGATEQDIQNALSASQTDTQAATLASTQAATQASTQTATKAAKKSNKN